MIEGLCSGGLTSPIEGIMEERDGFFSPPHYYQTLRHLVTIRSLECRTKNLRTAGLPLRHNRKETLLKSVLWNDE